MGGSSQATAALDLLPGKGDGTFRQPQTYTLDFPPRGGAVGDFNSDGAPDLVTANGTGATVSVLLNTGR